MKTIAFFDSGLGGLSVLKKGMLLLPTEKFLYYGDSKNNPYGEKDKKVIKELTEEAIKFLLDKGADAIVIACNTATSAAVKELREQYNHIPIIGMEPALKPAVEFVGNSGQIIVMATKFTLIEKKFNDLYLKYSKYNNILLIPNPELVKIVESGNYNDEILDKHFEELFKNIDMNQVKAIVLGCTHYIFVKEFLENKFNKIKIIDGNEGTIKETARKLNIIDKLDYSNNVLHIENLEIYNSLSEKIDFSYKMLEKC